MFCLLQLVLLVSLVESTTSTASLSSRSDSTERLLSVHSTDKDSVLSVELRLSDNGSLPHPSPGSSDPSDVRQVDKSQGDSETVRLYQHRLSSECTVEVDMTECRRTSTEAVPTDTVDGSDLHSDQFVDSDVCEEPVSVTNSGMSVAQTDDDSQQMSDVTENSPVPMTHQLNVDALTTLSNNRHSNSSIFSHPDQSKLTHSVVSSALKSTSQNEDHGLVYVVFSM